MFYCVCYILVDTTMTREAVIIYGVGVDDAYLVSVPDGEPTITAGARHALLIQKDQLQSGRSVAGLYTVELGDIGDEIARSKIRALIEGVFPDSTG